MTKRICILCLIAIFIFCFSTNSFAEVFEGNTESHATVIVNKQDNSIEFIYADSKDDVVDGVFNDIPGNAWYNEFVSILKQLDVINGVSETAFNPDQAITRGEYVKLIAAIAEDDLSDYEGISTFSDVNANDWYSEYIAWATENKIIQGKNNNQFFAQDNITREEAIVMLYRFALSHGEGIIYTERYNSRYPVSSFYDDNNVSAWAEDAVSFMTTIGIINGDEDNLLRPKDNISRSEAAKMLAVYYLLDKKPTLVTNGIELKYGNSLDFDESLIPISEEIATRQSDDVDYWNNITLAEGEEYTMYGTDDFILNESETDSGGISPLWSGNEHRSMVNQSLYILTQDNNKGFTPRKISMLSGSTKDYKYSSAALNYIQGGAEITDYEDQETMFSMAKHYYHYAYKYNSNGEKKYIEGYSKDPELVDDPLYDPYVHNARWGFNDHYYLARIYFESELYVNSYRELGMAIHYLQDTNSPPHARLIDNYSYNSAHSNYERWVKNNFYNSYWETSAAGSYDFMINSSFLDISSNFSELSGASYENCIKYNTNPTIAQNATAGNLKRTQRAVAGLLYRFLIDTGREF